MPASAARASRHRARAGRPAGVQDADGAREPGDGRLPQGRPRATGSTRWNASTRCSRSWPNARRSWPARCPAASSRCWRSAAASPRAPKLLMLDEPSMGLAPAVADTIFERISQIHREDGVTILLVEQRVAEALELSDHGYVLETGHMVLDGTVRDAAGGRPGPPFLSRADRRLNYDRMGERTMTNLSSIGRRGALGPRPRHRRRRAGAAPRCARRHRRR